MIKDYKVIAIIPARGGSKGIIDKNIKPLNDKPLIGYTIEAAKNSKYVDEIIVSTDSTKIKEVAENFGICVPELRPDFLATDTSKTVDAIVYEIDKLEINKEKTLVVLLQATSPLRNSTHIDEALDTIVNTEAHSLVSVNETPSHPYYLKRITDNALVDYIEKDGTNMRRQDLEELFVVNGAIYINLASEIDKYTDFNNNKIPYIMDFYSSVDIDIMFDFTLASIILKTELNN